MSGEIRSYSGDVFINERLSEEWSLPELAKCRSVMPQSVELSFDFSVMEVVLMGRSPHNPGWETEEDLAIALQCLEEVECADLKHRRFISLSGGEKQRVTLARILAQISNVEAPFLLMDEPTANLDPDHQNKSMQSARKRADEGATVFVILHDFNMASKFADKIYILNEGVITADGTPEDVLTEDIIKRDFNVSVQIQKHPVHGKPLVIFL
jgi:iron complex transport system ATP-binding protein